MDTDSLDILGGHLNARDSQSGWWSGIPFGLKSAFVLAVTLVLYVVGLRIRENFLVWREKAYKLSMRRKHGIPDNDHRPFNVAYAAVLRARQDSEEKARRARLQQLVPDQQNALPVEGARQRNPSSRNASTTRTPNPLPGRYESADIISSTSAYASNRNHSQLNADNYYNPNPAVRIADPEIDNSPPKAGPSRRATRYDDDGHQRGFENGQESDGLEHTKKMSVDDESDSHGEQEAEWPEDYGSRRGWKRGHGDDHDDDVDTNESMRLREKRQRKVSLDKSSQILNEDMDIDEEEEEKEEDDIGALRSIARGKKRDRAEAGSTFGGDDEDYSGHEVDQDDLKSRHRHRKRRTYSKRKSDVGVSSRGQKRDRGLAEEGSEAENEDTTLKVSRKKRGKRAAYAQDERSEVSMDDSLVSSTRSRPRRSIGEEWENNGVKYKIGPNGQRLRQTLVKKERQKFHMPEDSQHPDRQANLEVYIETWLTEEEYRAAKDQQLLAWQDSNKPSVEPQTPTIESQEELPPVAGKNLLWKSTSGSATPGTTSPRQISPPATPQGKQKGNDVFGSSIASNTGLRINPFGNVPPTGKRVSLARRPSTLRLDGGTTVPPSPTGSTAPNLADSTNNSARHRTFSKWEKQDLEAKAMMKMREANRLKEEERQQKLKKEQEAAAASVKSIPTITVTKADEAKPAETKPASTFSFAPTPAAPDAPKKDVPNPLFSAAPAKAPAQPPLFAPSTSQPATKPPAIPTNTAAPFPAKAPGSLFGTKPEQASSFVSFGPPPSSAPSAPAPASAVPANPGISLSKPSFSFGPTPAQPQPRPQATADEKKSEPAGGSLLSRLASAGSAPQQSAQPSQPSFSFAKPAATDAPKAASAFANPNPPQASAFQPAPAAATTASAAPKFDFGFNKPTSAAPAGSSSLAGALGPTTETKPASNFFSAPAPTTNGSTATSDTTAASAPKFNFALPKASGPSSFAAKSPTSNPFAPPVNGAPTSTSTTASTAPAPSVFGFGTQPATNGTSTTAPAPAPSAFSGLGSTSAFGVKPATDGSSAPAPAQSAFSGLGGKPAATFGTQPAGTSTAATSVFGSAFGQPAAGASSTPTQSPFGNGGGFETKPAENASTGSSGAFGPKPGSSVAPAFGGSGFGGLNGSGASTSTPSPFGANNAFSFGAGKPSTTPSSTPAAATDNTTKPLFSFGTPSAPSTTPLATPSATPVLSKLAPPTGSSVFGTSAFGSSATNGSSFKFGDAAKAPQGDSPFGKPADPSAFGFGGGNAFSSFGKVPATPGQQQQQ